MGHTRLGDIPKTQEWADVVATLLNSNGIRSNSLATSGDAVAEIADKTLEAAQAGLEKALDDLGLQYTFYLLTQIALAARTPDWRSRLAELHINLLEGSTIVDLTMELQCAIDDHIAEVGYRTDIGEIAQQAVGEALLSLAGPRTITLFGSGSVEVQRALRELSTTRGFARLGQRFFGRFMARFLNFYLSRVTASNVNTASLPHIGDVTKFNDQLELHCEQSAKVVRDFTGQWYSKTEYLNGIDLKNTSGFIVVAVKKMREEMKRQRLGS